MESDEGKLFIGGIAWDTTEGTLRDYFTRFGDVSQVVIMRDKTTGRPRGFGFVVFSDPSVLDQVLQDKHTIDGRPVEAKRALSREEQHNSRSGNFNSGRGSEGGGYFKTKKIFVGGLPPTLTEDGFRQYFENYGHVTDVVVMYDQNTQRPRGFGFITFETEDAVDNVLQKVFHELNGKLVEVKRALPKDASGGGRSGGYQGYGASGGNTSSFDGRMDGNRYMQTQSNAGGFPPFSGYGAAGYGYGAASGGVGYGGYGGYGMGGYGSTGPGFGGPAGAYGNPNAGFISAAPGALKSSWGSQNPSGYGTSGYDANAGYGANRGSAVSPLGHSSSGASGYGNQGYGYSNYGGSSGPYSGGYGAAGGRAGSGAGGENEYGDTNGNSGYTNASWRSDSSQTSSGYSGGYGGAHSRQAQQQ